MHPSIRIFFTGALFSIITATLLAACDNKNDPVTAADHADKQAGIAAPGIVETKAIAEEAFIYGLPIVMNYAVMNEFVVDKNSSQYKGSFNSITNESRFYLQGYSGSHPQQRHALFHALAGFTCRANSHFCACR